MEIYSTEEQQVEAIKRAAREYGPAIIAGVVIGLGGLYGWKTYNQAQIESSEAASDAYTKFIETAGQENSQVVANSDAFLAEHKDSNYAVLAAFVASKEAVEAAQFDVAKAKLNWILANSANAELKAIATTRLARIEKEQGNLDAALALLAGPFSNAFTAQVQELKGDILLAKGDTAAATTAYQAAIDASAATANPLLEVKLNNLAAVAN